MPASGHRSCPPSAKRRIVSTSSSKTRSVSTAAAKTWKRAAAASSDENVAAPQPGSCLYGSRSSTSQPAATGPRASSLANTCGTLPGAPCDAADIQNRSRRVALTFTSTSVPSGCQVPVSQVENEWRAGRRGRSPVRRPDVAGCSPSARSSSDQTPGSSRSRRRSCDHHGTGESSHTSSAATRLASPACPPGATELPETPGSGSCPRPSPRPDRAAARRSTGRPRSRWPVR